MIDVSGYVFKGADMRTFIRGSALGLTIWAQAALVPSAALACGGFFCNQAQPVNQAAEGIIFADNGDGTTTAVIQIRYQGPSKSFSWLLPISSAPKSDADIGIASNLAFQRLQAATNPNYRLTTKIEGVCKQDDGVLQTATGSSSNSAGGSSSAGTPLVVVEASGVVGSFEWTVISVNASSANPADAAVAWLQENGYDVPSGSPQLLRPYLESGMHLLALRLTKGADSGSIRPIILTYEGTQPSIPMKLTAVAANADMGVLTWVLGKSRSVPQNYLSLELNEARINWFNANTNYNSVVTAAADDAGGQGFVTEFAGPASTLKSQVWTAVDEANWTQFKTAPPQASNLFFNQAVSQYGQWDGFWDTTRAVVTLPAGVSFDQLKACSTCYAATVSFEPASYLAELEKSVIEPVKRVQKLIDAHPQITRMYTTLSADEMTLDPLFTFNADLPAVSNQHVADRVVECNPNVAFSQAPWRIQLPQGGVIRGVGSQTGTWPAALGNLPPNRTIVRTAASGEGKLLEDNSADIEAQLTAYNAGMSTGGSAGTVAAAGTPGTAGKSGMPGTIVAPPRDASAGGMAGNPFYDDVVPAAPRGGAARGGDCSVARGGHPLVAFFGASALGVLLARRRRRY
jgi:MYXO-CTERM domain-containing protein